jgi:pimeloyl-ACP methyl ester carboxylesterase
MPDRVVSVALGCPVSPFEAVDTTGALAAKAGIRAQHHPRAIEAVFGQIVSALRRHPDRLPVLVALQGRELGPVDMAFFKDHAERNLVFQQVDEAFRQGTAEVVHAIALMMEPWASWLKNVCTNVNILQGSQDHIVTPTMSRQLAGLLPNSQIRFFPDDGHLTIEPHHAAELLAAALPTV